MQRILVPACGFLLSGGLRADTVKLRGKPEFRNVTITDFRNGQLVFRGVSGQFLRKPLAQVETLEITGRAALSDAEQAAAAGDWPTASARYQAAAAEPGEPWLRDLARLRLLPALDAAGPFDDAVRLYIELVAANIAPAAANSPRRPGAPGTAANRAALVALERAMAGQPGARTGPLRLLATELRIYEDLPNDAATDGGAATRPVSTPAGGRPANDAGIRAPDSELPAPVDILNPAATTRPAPRTAEPVQLAADSFVLVAAREAFDRGDFARSLRLLERAIPLLPVADRAPWRLLLGRSRIGLASYPEAAADLLALAQSPQDPVLAAEALYYVGLAHERMDRADVAENLYREVAQSPSAADAVRALAQEGLRRLKK